MRHWKTNYFKSLSQQRLVTPYCYALVLLAKNPWDLCVLHGRCGVMGLGLVSNQVRVFRCPLRGGDAIAQLLG